jgi:hypothetical protein
MSIRNLPYVTNPGTLRTMLERIRESIQPDRFTGDFVETKLKMKGGTAKSMVPFLKKMGLVSADGIPTDLYKEYRNKPRSSFVIAKGMQNVYSDIFDQNEYAYDLSDRELMGLIVQLTGGDEKSRALKFTLSTFKLLKEMANFDESEEPVTQVVQENTKPTSGSDHFTSQLLQYQGNQSVAREESVNLSYTINLNLPATTNIEVFNAIFKSLKEHLINQ